MAKDGVAGHVVRNTAYEWTAFSRVAIWRWVKSYSCCIYGVQRDIPLQKSNSMLVSTPTKLLSIGTISLGMSARSIL